MIVHARRPALYCCQGRVERRSLRRWRQWWGCIDDGQLFDFGPDTFEQRLEY